MKWLNMLEKKLENSRFTQFTSTRRLEFEFHDTYLEYADIPKLRGHGSRRNIHYEDLADTFEWYKYTNKKDIISVAITFVGGLAIYYLFLSPWVRALHIKLDSFPEILWILAAVGIIALCWQKSGNKQYVNHFTIIPYGDDKSVAILHDKNHQQIIQEIENRRTKTLKKYAVIDMTMSSIEQVHRFRWLNKNNIISFDELVRLEKQVKQLFAGFNFILSRPNSNLDQNASYEDKQFSQKLLFNTNTHYFCFRKEYLEYTGDELTFKLHYHHIPPSDKYQKIYKRDDQWSYTVLLCSFFGIASRICLLFEYYKRGHLDISTMQGFLKIAEFLPVIPVCLMALYFVHKATNTNFVNIQTSKGLIQLADDTKKQIILDEIYARRRTALRKLAFIDDLNDPQNELKKFNHLKDEGIVSDAEFTIFKQTLVERIHAVEPDHEQKEKNFLH
jgi:hypothetical protein